jgi:hypothetical protein
MDPSPAITGETIALRNSLRVGRLDVIQSAVEDRTEATVTGRHVPM